MKTITITGIGKLSVKPDLIVISMQLDTENKEYDQAMLSASEKINALNKSLEELGFSKDTLKTTNFNVRTIYENIKDETGRYKNVFKGYSCIHNLKLEFDFDTKQLSKVLSRISACIAKPELSILFTIKDKTKINEELLKSASFNALEKAKILCLASNVKLGNLISINYSWGELNVHSDTNYKVEARCMMKAESCLSNIDIEPEDIDITDSATFVWKII